jgi:hypothetical protein
VIARRRAAATQRTAGPRGAAGSSRDLSAVADPTILDCCVPRFARRPRNDGAPPAQIQRYCGTWVLRAPVAAVGARRKTGVLLDALWTAAGALSERAYKRKATERPWLTSLVAARFPLLLRRLRDLNSQRI